MKPEIGTVIARWFVAYLLTWGAVELALWQIRRPKWPVKEHVTASGHHYFAIHGEDGRIKSGGFETREAAEKERDHSWKLYREWKPKK